MRFLLAKPRAPDACSRPTSRKPTKGSGYIVLAMGKMGAFELNYSSDIDLIVFYDPDAAALAQGCRAGAVLRAAHARLVKLLQERTRRRLCVPRSICGCGPIRPRPRSRSRPQAALNYYESVGQNWERAAHDQGARLRRRYRGRRKLPRANSRPSSGASISTSPRSPTCTR